MASTTDPSSQIRILLVEDDPDAAEVLALILRASGYEVCVTHDALEALAEFTRMQPTVAIVDVGLPVMNGYQLALRLRVAGGCGLIAVSGSAPMLDGPEASAFDEYLMKPVDFARLRVVISKLAAQRVFSDSTRG